MAAIFADTEEAIGGRHDIAGRIVRGAWCSRAGIEDAAFAPAPGAVREAKQRRARVDLDVDASHPQSILWSSVTWVTLPAESRDSWRTVM